MNLTITGDVAPADTDTFFKWVPSEAYSLDNDPDNTEMTRVFLVHVDDALVARFVDEVGEDPQPGWYLCTWNSDGVLDAFGYGEDSDTAAAEADAFMPDKLVLVSTTKPNGVVLPVEARVLVDGSARFEDVLLFGLNALGESSVSLFGYGVRGFMPGETIENQTVTVYGNRD